MKRTICREIEDLGLLALLVARQLRVEHGIDDGPAAGDYELVAGYGGRAAQKDLRLKVDLGRGASVRVSQLWWSVADRELENLVEAAEEFATEIARVRGEAADIRSMLSEVRAAAKREVAKANRRGVPHRLISIAPNPIQAGGSGDLSALVTVEMLDESARLGPHEFDACDAGEVAAEFQAAAERQSALAFRRTQLDRAGATGAIDAVVLARLRDWGVDVAGVLNRLRDEGDATIDVEAADGAKLCLYWKEGVVRSAFALADGVNWNEGRIRFTAAPKAVCGSVVGRPLAELFPHRYIGDDVIVLSACGKPGGHASLRCSEPLVHFDVQTGRVWPAA